MGTQKLALPLFALMLLAGLNVIEISAQTSELKLLSGQNGFSGEYASGNTKLFVDYQFLPMMDRSVSRIQNLSGKSVVESTREQNVIEVKIADVSIIFKMDEKNPERSKPSELSRADTQKLKEFRLSNESAHVRTLIGEFIKRKAEIGTGRLKGFLTIAMVLGDGPGVPDRLQSKVNCSSSKLIQTYASYSLQSLPTGKH